MQIRKDISRETKIYFELNENRNTSKFVGWQAMEKNKYTKHINIYVTEEQKAYIDKMKKEGHMKTSDVIRIMIDRYIEHRKFLRGDER